MLRTLALVGLVAAPFLAIAPQQQSGAAVIIGPGVQPCNALQQEPVVMYDISGYTLSGVYHLHLMVYDNGATHAICRRSARGFLLGPCTTSAPLSNDVW